jgi:hypothetical protein
MLARVHAQLDRESSGPHHRVPGTRRFASR